MDRAVYITSTAHFLPNAPVSNDAMEAVLGQIGPRPSRARPVVLRHNGIRQRFYAIDPASGQPTHTNAQLAAAAIERLADGDDFSPQQLACLAAGTSMPDQLMPGHGVMVHGELGGQACEVVSLAGICLAGLAALKYAWMSVRSGNSAQAVASGSEVASAVLHARHFAAESSAQALQSRPELAFDKDFLRWMLSDGAGAVLLRTRPRQRGVSLRVDWLELASHAHALPACMYQGARRRADGSLQGWQQLSQSEALAQSVFAVRQDVRLLNQEVVAHTLAQPLARIMQRRALRAGQIDWFLPHMSSAYFREPIARALEDAGLPIAPQRWLSNLSTTGNTGSAAFFIMLDALFHSAELRPGHTVLCFVPESGRFSSGFLHLTAVDGHG